MALLTDGWALMRDIIVLYRPTSPLHIYSATKIHICRSSLSTQVAKILPFMQDLLWIQFLGCCLGILHVFIIKKRTKCLKNLIAACSWSVDRWVKSAIAVGWLSSSWTFHNKVQLLFVGKLDYFSIVYVSSPSLRQSWKTLKTWILSYFTTFLSIWTIFIIYTDEMLTMYISVWSVVWTASWFYLRRRRY